jgi:tRNA pseudouridine38-40 synthase
MEKPPYNYKLTLAYDGTNFSGWQVQPHAESIQEIIQKAIHLITRETVCLIGSGRTDAGVHALAQVAHFRSHVDIDLQAFFRSINGILPYDIRLLQVERATLDFHAQRSAKGKIYHYNICLDPIVMPFERLYVYQERKKVDLHLLEEACKRFVGEHDFSSFANSQHHGACSKNPVRTIYRLDAVKTTSGVRLEFEGNGFLYKMVRNIVGMLLEVSTGKRSIHEIDVLFTAKDRRLAPKSAPARGLFLVKVIYQ